MSNRNWFAVKVTPRKAAQKQARMPWRPDRDPRHGYGKGRGGAAAAVRR